MQNIFPQNRLRKTQIPIPFCIAGTKTHPFRTGGFSRTDPAGNTKPNSENAKSERKRAAMKARKAWIAAVLALAMVLGMAGCSNRGPTAQELVDGVPTIDLEKYNDIELEMNVTAQADGQTSTIMMSVHAEADGNISHLYDMDTSLEANGVSLAFSSELWMEKDTDLMYSRMSIFGQDLGWTLFPRNGFP